MITIHKKEIQKFIVKSSHISDTKRLPIYAYVKLVCAESGSKLIKHNGNKFVVVDIHAEFDKETTMLIETDIFFGYVNAFGGEYLNISLKGNNIVLTAPNTKLEAKSQATKDLYPTIDSNDSETKRELNSDVLSALSAASSHTFKSNDGDMRGWLSYVHMKKMHGKYWVIGTMMSLTYFKSFTQELPETTLDPADISVLKGMHSVEHSIVGNYDYFESMGAVYGFKKTESRCSSQVENVLDNFNKVSTELILPRQQMIDFCKLVISVDKFSQFPTVVFHGEGKDEVKISFQDEAQNNSLDDILPAEEKTIKFKEMPFQAKTLLIALNHIDGEKVKISYGHKNFILKSDDDPDYVGAVMEYGVIVKQEQELKKKKQTA